MLLFEHIYRYTLLGRVGWGCNCKGCGSLSSAIGLTAEDLLKLGQLVPGCIQNGKLQNTSEVEAAILGYKLGYAVCPKHEGGDGEFGEHVLNPPKGDFYPPVSDIEKGFIIAFPPDMRSCTVYLEGQSNPSHTKAVTLTPSNILQAAVAMEIAPDILKKKPVPQAGPIDLTYGGCWYHYRPVGSEANLHLSFWDRSRREWRRLSIGNLGSWSAITLAPDEIAPFTSALYKAIKIMAEEAPDWPHLTPIKIEKFSIKDILPDPTMFLFDEQIRRIAIGLRGYIKADLEDREWVEIEKFISPLRKAGITYSTPYNWIVVDKSRAIPHELKLQKSQPMAVNIIRAADQRDAKSLTSAVWQCEED